MNIDDTPTNFAQYHGLVFGIAYRMLGSASDAEDVVQETYLRWQEQNVDTIDNPSAYLTRTVTNLCIDTLRKNRRARELYSGPWLPEPLLDSDAPENAPEAAAALADTLSVALLAMFEELNPHERATFILRHALDLSFNEIALCMNAKSATCRQWHQRAKKKLQGVPWDKRTPGIDREMMEEFSQKLATNDIDGILGLMSEDVILLSDGGGKVAAASKPVIGARAVSRFLLGIIALNAGRITSEIRELNSSWGALVYLDNKLDSVSTITLGRDGLIKGIYIVRNPDKLAHLKARLSA